MEVVRDHIMMDLVERKIKNLGYSKRKLREDPPFHNLGYSNIKMRENLLYTLRERILKECANKEFK